MARLPAVARCIHQPGWEKADRASYGRCPSTRAHRRRIGSRSHICARDSHVRSLCTVHLAGACRSSARRQKAHVGIGVSARTAARLTVRTPVRLRTVEQVSLARKAAFKILRALESGQAHSDDLLRGKSVSALTAQDRHLATALVLGVLRWQLELDQVLRPLLKHPNAKLDT